MSDNRAVAGIIMKEAWETIAKKRPGVHGSAEQSFEMIADFWTVYLRHIRKTRGADQLRPEDVAEMMSMLKKARKVYGDPSNIDNDVDDLGYTGLGGMLRLPDITKDKEAQLDESLSKLDIEQPGDGTFLKKEGYAKGMPLKSDVTDNGHEHIPLSIAPDDDGFVPCAVAGCDVKVQVAKPKRVNKASKGEE